MKLILFDYSSTNNIFAVISAKMSDLRFMPMPILKKMAKNYALFDHVSNKFIGFYNFKAKLMYWRTFNSISIWIEDIAAKPSKSAREAHILIV